MVTVSKWALYVLVVCGMTVAPIILTVANNGYGLWFGLVPLVCIGLLNAVKAKVEFRWTSLVEDVKSGWRFLCGLGAYNVVSAIVHSYLLKDLHIPAELNILSIGNIVEELYFRATFVSLLERLEVRLFDSPQQVRIAWVTGVAFGLAHVSQVLNTSVPILRYIAIENVIVASIIGFFLSTVYCRSRNLPACVAIHWWVNLQSQVLRYWASSLYR